MHHQQQPQTKRGQAFFRQQVWQSNSSLETCKVSRETNWPFDTAEACIMSRETFESRLSRTFIITILLTSQKPTLMLKLQHRPNYFKRSFKYRLHIWYTKGLLGCWKIHEKSHLSPFSLTVWIWKCLFIWKFVRNDLSQNSHLNAFSLLWVFRW